MSSPIHNILDDLRRNLEALEVEADMHAETVENAEASNAQVDEELRRTQKQVDDLRGLLIAIGVAEPNSLPVDPILFIEHVHERLANREWTLTKAKAS